MEFIAFSGWFRLLVCARWLAQEVLQCSGIPGARIGDFNKLLEVIVAQLPTQLCSKDILSASVVSLFLIPVCIHFCSFGVGIVVVETFITLIHGFSFEQVDRASVEEESGKISLIPIFSLFFTLVCVTRSSAVYLN